MLQVLKNLLFVNYFIMEFLVCHWQYDSFNQELLQCVTRSQKTYVCVQMLAGEVYRVTGG